MKNYIAQVFADILTSIYQPFWFSTLLSVIFMSVWIHARKRGWKAVVHEWWIHFRKDTMFRRTLCLAFYTTLILFKTLLNRDMWANPLSNIMGGWGLNGAHGIPATEAIENFLLLLPFILLLYWAKNYIRNEKYEKISFILWNSLKTAFLFSACIEMTQVILRLGTFQLADLTYNTSGGVVGGIIYYMGLKISHLFEKAEKPQRKRKPRRPKHRHNKNRESQ